MLYSVCVVLVWVVGHLIYRFRVIGRSNLPKAEKGKPGSVIVCNHISAMDIVFLVLARFRWPKAAIMGKAELFEIHPALSWVFRRWGAVPVSRGKGDVAVVEKLVEAVKNGQDLLIFPEGTRSKTGEMGVLKTGAFLIAARAGASVVPCRVLYQTGRPKLFGKVRIVIGEPLAPEELGLAEVESAMPLPSALRRAKNRVAQEMEDLRAAYAHTVEK